MSRRRRSDRVEHWEGVVADWRASGLTRAAYCRQHSLNYQTMASWARRLEKSGVTRSRRTPGTRRSSQAVATVGSAESTSRGTETSFLEVSLPATTRRAPYEIVLGHDRSIRFGADFDADVLTQLIRAVESC